MYVLIYILIIEMPPKKSNNNNNNNDNQDDSFIDKYKVLPIYKKIKIIDDDLKKKLEELYEDNVWNLKQKFKDLKDMNEEMNKNNDIPFENGIPRCSWLLRQQMPYYALDKYHCSCMSHCIRV